MARGLQVRLVMPVFPSLPHLSALALTVRAPGAAGGITRPGPRGLFARIFQALSAARHAGAGKATGSRDGDAIPATRDLDTTITAPAEGMPINALVVNVAVSPLLQGPAESTDAGTVAAEDGGTESSRRPFTGTGTLLRAILHQRGLLAALAGRRPQPPVQQPPIQQSPMIGREGAEPRADPRIVHHGPGTRSAAPLATASLPIPAASTAGVASASATVATPVATPVATARVVRPDGTPSRGERPGSPLPSGTSTDPPVAGERTVAKPVLTTAPLIRAGHLAPTVASAPPVDGQAAFPRGENDQASAAGTRPTTAVTSRALTPSAVSGVDGLEMETAVAPANHHRRLRPPAKARPLQLRGPQRSAGDASKFPAGSTPEINVVIRPAVRAAAPSAALAVLKQASQLIGQQPSAGTPAAVPRGGDRARVRSAARQTARGRVTSSVVRPAGVMPSGPVGGNGVGRFPSEPATEQSGAVRGRGDHLPAAPTIGGPSAIEPPPEAATTRATQPVFHRVMEAAAGLRSGSQLTLRLAETPFGQLRMTVYRRGDTVRVRIFTASDQTGTALRGEHSTLARMLEARGLHLGDMSVEVKAAPAPTGAGGSNPSVSSDTGASAHQHSASPDPSSAHSQGDSRAASRRHRRAARSASRTAAASAVSRARRETPAGSTSRLDLRV